MAENFTINIFGMNMLQITMYIGIIIAIVIMVLMFINTRDR